MRKLKITMAAIFAASTVCVSIPAVPAYFPEYSNITAVQAAGTENSEEPVEGKYENLYYRKYSDHIEISGCDESATEVVIPAEIEGLPVTSISVWAFGGCSGLTSITIPDSVTSIVGSAFYGTPWLEAKQKENPLVIVNNIVIDGTACKGDVVIPNGVTSIGDSAFSECYNLTSITIPDSVISIGGAAFASCSGLTSITIPSSVTKIGYSAFFNCSGLTSITIPDGVTSIGGGAFDCTPWLEARQKENPLVVVNNILIDGKTCDGDVVIPDGIITISDGAFRCCSGLTSITIPDSVTSIEGSAFAGCSGLTSVTIPDSVISIDDEAFAGCSGLTSITIPDSVTSIGVCAFGGCSGLTSITIPDGVTSIGGSAFGGCSGLTSITIPNSVTSIGDYAFNDTPWLEAKQKENPLVVVNNILIDGKTCDGDVVIPDDIITISDGAFRCCSGLKSITISSGVTNIGDCVFFGCENLTSITIPNSVTSIENSAFSECFGLTSITILNPYCKIYDDSYTICNGLGDNGDYFNGTIKGYENSTAQAYAEKYGYNFESMGEAPTYKTGDVNDDSLIDSTDASAILVEYALASTEKPSEFSDTQKKAGDIDGDGKLDSTDASTVLIYYSYLSTGGTIKDMNQWLQSSGGLI